MTLPVSGSLGLCPGGCGRDLGRRVLFACPKCQVCGLLPPFPPTRRAEWNPFSLLACLEPLGVKDDDGATGLDGVPRSLRGAISRPLEQLWPSGPHALGCGGGSQLQTAATRLPAPLRRRKLRPPSCLVPDGSCDRWDGRARTHVSFLSINSLIIRLAVSLGLGNKKLMELPNRHSSGHPCRELCVASVMRRDQSQVDPSQEAFQRARGLRSGRQRGAGL